MEVGKFYGLTTSTLFHNNEDLKDMFRFFSLIHSGSLICYTSNFELVW
jgi:hypothetical protein